MITATDAGDHPILGRTVESVGTDVPGAFLAEGWALGVRAAEALHFFLVFRLFLVFRR